MYLNYKGKIFFVSAERIKKIIDEHKRESKGFMIIALIKDNDCFVVDEVFKDKQNMASRIAKYKLEGYKVITNEDNRTDKS